MWWSMIKFMDQKRYIDQNAISTEAFRPMVDIALMVNISLDGP